MNVGELFTVKDGASLLGVSEAAIRAAIREHRIKTEKHLNRIVISRAQLEEYKAKTQPEGIPRVGRPSSSLTPERISENRSISANKPYTVKQLIEKRVYANRVLGTKMRQRRMELGWSQKQLGDRIGFTRELVAQYETGRANINAADLPLIAEVLDVSLNWFYDNLSAMKTVHQIQLNINAMSDADKLSTFDEMATIFTKRLGTVTQVAIEFGPEADISLADDYDADASSQPVQGTVKIENGKAGGQRAHSKSLDIKASDQSPVHSVQETVHQPAIVNSFFIAPSIKAGKTSRSQRDESYKKDSDKP